MRRRTDSLWAWARPRLRPAAVVVSVAVLAALAGPRLVGPIEQRTALGEVAFEARPALDGRAEAFIPVADWGLRADPFTAPLRLYAELRALDRDAVVAAAGGERSVLVEAAQDLEAGARRAALWTVGASMLLGAGLALLVARTPLWPGSRPWRPAAAVAALLALGGGASLLVAERSFDQEAFEQPTYFARGSELPRLLASTEVGPESGGYGSTFLNVLRGLSVFLADADEDGSAARSLTLASDLHNNALVLEPLDEFSGDRPLIFAGDFGQRGDEREAALLAPRLARLGSEVVAVSGNHDSRGLMRRLREEGVVVLDERRPGAEVAGLQVFGWPDPLVYEEGSGRPRIVTFEDSPQGDALRERAEADLREWFDGLPRPPDVVVLHQWGLAANLARSLHESGRRRPLTILAGHDHRQRVERWGEIVLVDGGTVGASGLFEIGEGFAGFARLDFDDDGRLASVDLVSVEPISGRARAERVVVDALCPEEEQCSYEPAAPELSLLAGGPPDEG